jgi:N-acetylmuramoyl-L-alanine amidase
MRVVISSGHGKLIRGASDIIDEVDQARRVVNRVVSFINAAGETAIPFHDNTSTTQNQNLETIVKFHNKQERDLDVSVHFNAYEHTSKPMGTECLYVSQSELAKQMAKGIADVGDLIDRGPKKRTDLYFLNNTEEPAILIEVCFVDSQADVEAYESNFDYICDSIARVIIGEKVEAPPPEAAVPDSALFDAKGKCSWFGGPSDTGVSSSEGLAFLYSYGDAPHLFLPSQPPGTTGLARRLNPGVFYVACRWDYDITPKDMLDNPSLLALVKANGREFLAWPADWGPHEDTGRVADLSPGLMEALGVGTDDQVEIIYPAPEGLFLS